jgi:hypothetical protein
MLKILLYPFKFFFSLISLFISIKSFFFLIYKFNFKNKIVFLQPEGGFGHTILTPEVLNKLFRNNEWILVFGHDPRRHNYLVKDLYKNNFFWLDLTYSSDLIKGVFEPFKKFIFFLLSLYLKFKKIEYYYYFDYLLKLKDYDHSKYNKEDSLLYERISYKIIFKSQSLRNSNSIDKGFKNLNFNIKKKKNCGLAYKQSTYRDINSINRSSDTLESYKESLFSMVDLGWDVYIYGDLPLALPNWFDDLKKNIFFSENKKNLNKFNLYSGVNSECYIGPMSGALSWKYMFPKKPSLIIDAHPFGWSYFNSVISYRIISRLNKNHKNLEDTLIKKKIYWYNTDPYKYRYTDQYEKKSIIINFLKNVNYISREILTPNRLGLPKDHPVSWSYSSISKTWYKIQESVLKKNNI